MDGPEQPCAICTTAAGVDGSSSAWSGSVEVKDAVRGMATTTTLRLTTNVPSAAAAARHGEGVAVGGSGAGTRCVARLNVDVRLG